MNKKYFDNNITPHKDETVLITGGNSGIGFAFIKHLLKREYQVIFTVRSKEKGDKAIKELKEEFPSSNIKYMLLDLSSFESINKFVKEITKKKIDIHHFYHNAGIFRVPFSKDEEGFEINTKTNYFGPYVLNESLIPYFHSLPHEVHVNFVFSLTTYYYQLNVKELNPKEQYEKMETYARSKIMIVHYYYFLIVKYANSNIKFTLSHPGATYTPLIDKGYKINWFKKLATIFMKIAFHKPEKASYTYLLALENKDPYLYIAPRGFLELSGYPKYKKLRRSQYKDYLLTIKITQDLLKNHI